MIEGVVSACHEAVITLILRGPTGQVQDVAVVVDTGGQPAPVHTLAIDC